jgi:2-amino-4-hydroxy-6-hydroxymethyldihydropteridine diphosphokinase
MVCYLGLGSNLGDRLRALRHAAASLAAYGRVEAGSAIYETTPEGNADQPLYLNAVLRIATGLGPLPLLDRCLAIEREHGRTRDPRVDKAPRTLDIDVLLYGQDCLAGDRIEVPHPRLLVRPFVRIPLAEVAVPGLRHPRTGEPLDRAAADAGVRRVPGASLSTPGP